LTRPFSSHRPSGCLGGRGFSFLSHIGNLQTCGFIDIPCGNIRDFNFDFKALVSSASNPLGKCGSCRGKCE
jgi:MoaA/NifB/PqqE/SkfB family radical SAM enzyme